MPEAVEDDGLPLPSLPKYGRTRTIPMPAWVGESQAEDLPHATPERPYVVLGMDAAGEPAVVGTYADHRQAKPARTRAGGGQDRSLGGWAHKTRAWLVCGRCERLHGS